MLSIKYGIKRTDSVQDLPESVLILFKMVKKVIAGGLMKCVCLLLN